MKSKNYQLWPILSRKSVGPEKLALLVLTPSKLFHHDQNSFCTCQLSILYFSAESRDSR